MRSVLRHQCNPVALGAVRYGRSVDPQRSGRNIPRAPATTHRYELAAVVQALHPMEQIGLKYGRNTSTYHHADLLFRRWGLSDGDVTNPFFNQPNLNSGVSVAKRARLKTTVALRVLSER